MAGANSFDQWQKDVFFSAAEEVQESADIMESVYRMWVRDRSDGFKSDTSDELCRELQIALGTAKWQLEEFERAVNLSHESCSSDGSTITRHRQFIVTIENQISHIEKVLSESLVEEGKQPLRWVQLDEEERDDLAVFLGVAPQTLPEMKDRYVDHDVDAAQVRTVDSIRGFKETVTINEDIKYVVEVAAKGYPKSEVEVLSQGEQLKGQRRTWSSPDINSWKIVIADEEGAGRKALEVMKETPNCASSLRGFLRSVKSTGKSNWFRNSFQNAKSREHLQLRQFLLSCLNLKGITRFTQRKNGPKERIRGNFGSCKEDSKVPNVQQLVGRAGGFQRQIHASQYYMQFSRSLRVTFLLLLTIFLLGVNQESSVLEPKRFV